MTAVEQASRLGSPTRHIVELNSGGASDMMHTPVISALEDGSKRIINWRPLQRETLLNAKVFGEENIVTRVTVK